MRSLVIFLVSHDDTTDYVQDMAESVAREYASGDIVMEDWTVRVDVPECFVLDTGQTPTKQYEEAFTWDPKRLIAELRDMGADDALVFMASADRRLLAGLYIYCLVEAGNA